MQLRVPSCEDTAVWARRSVSWLLKMGISIFALPRSEISNFSHGWEAL